VVSTPGDIILLVLWIFKSTLRAIVRDGFRDLRVTALPPKHALRAPASMPFFKPHPCCLTYFLPTAAKSKQKGPLAKLCSSSNYL